MLLVFAAIGWTLMRLTGHLEFVPLALLGFLGTTLRVSYHVFYQTSFLHLRSAYAVNRVSEGVREEDLREDPWTLRLQRTFQLLYGWQDRLMVRLDLWCRKGSAMSDERWYGDRIGLRWSGLLGLGTELFLVMAFSLADALGLYLAVNLVCMNALWAGCLVYRKLLGRR